MSIQAAIGRIDQIIALQQQVADPSLASPGATTAASSTPASATGGAALSGGASTASFAAQLATAQSATATEASDPLAGVPATGTSAGAQVQAMTTEADSLLGKPYVYGGGHSGWGPQSGYDCSGFVSAVLHAGGYLSSPVDTTALPSQAGMQSGPGQYVTVYDRALPGQSGHVIIEINGQFYESGGMHAAWGGGGGVQKIAQPSASYLATFETVLHPAGL